VSGPLLGRAAGLLALLVLFVMLLARGFGLASGGVLWFIHLVDLVFHEAGHPIFGILGRFPGALGGSLNQVLVPAICTGYFLYHGQRAAGAVALFWTGENVLDVAIYVADGRDMKLPLLAEGLTHDWNWILSELSLRNQAAPIGRAVVLAGVSILLAALGLLAVDLARVATAPAAGRVLSSDRPSSGDRNTT